MTDLTRYIRREIARDWPDIEVFFEELANTLFSERATVIIGAAMLDLILRRLLVALIIDEAVAIELVGREESGGDQPLSAFSARIRACLGLGLINSDERAALDTIRKIRNAYAHKLNSKISEQSLDAAVQRLCALVFPEHRRDQFATGLWRSTQLRNCLLTLAIELSGRINKIERRSPWHGENTIDWQKDWFVDPLF